MTSVLMTDRTVLITGLLRPTSIAASVALAVHEAGGQLVLTTQPRVRRLAEATVQQLGLTAPILDFEATDPQAGPRLLEQIDAQGVARLDGALHSMAWAHRRLLSGSLRPPCNTSEARQWQDDVSLAFLSSVASLPVLADAVAPRMTSGGSILTLSFDTAHVHDGYGWMGPMKAALEATVRSLAMDLGERGISVNALSSGPLRTPAGSVIPAFEGLIAAWEEAAPIGWNGSDAAPVARTALAFFAGLMPATTGEVIACDGGATLGV